MPSVPGLEAIALGLAKEPFWMRYVRERPWWADESERDDQHGTALRLLLSHLSPEQLQEFTEKLAYRVQGSSGRVYTLHWNDVRGHPSNYGATHYTTVDDAGDSWCVLSSDKGNYDGAWGKFLAKGDMLLSNMLALQADDTRFMMVARGYQRFY